MSNDLDDPKNIIGLMTMNLLFYLVLVILVQVDIAALSNTNMLNNTNADNIMTFAAQNMSSKILTDSNYKPSQDYELGQDELQDPEQGDNVYDSKYDSFFSPLALSKLYIFIKNSQLPAFTLWRYFVYPMPIPLLKIIMATFLTLWQIAILGMWLNLILGGLKLLK